MRRRHQVFLALLFGANACVALSFAGLAIADHALPVPILAGVGLALGPTPGGAFVVLPSPAPPATDPARLPVQPSALPTASSTAPALLGSSNHPADPAPTATPLPTLAPDAFVPPAAELPPAAEVAGVVGHRQSLPLSCESRSAADWAGFYGVAIDELEFLNQLPTSDDPDRGFVGDVRGAWGQVPPNAYGVHAGPVARLLQSYGLRAQARRYIEWDVVRAELAAGRPVIAWVVGHVEGGASEVYTAADGRQTIVARFEHTVIVVAYSADTVTVVDGARRYDRPLNTFLESWAVLRNMAITLDG